MAEQRLKDSRDLLEEFASGSNLDIRMKALTELIKKKVLHAAREDSRLETGLVFLGELAANPTETVDRLRAVAGISRMDTVKSLQGATKNLLSAAMKRPLPDPSLLSDPDDRYYIARALQNCKKGWVTAYASTIIVDEKQAEKSRHEFVAVLFNRLDSLAEVFSLLAEELGRLKPETKNPGDSVAKRLERILAALRPQIVSLLIEPGKDAGKQIYGMVQAAFSSVGAPETHQIAVKFVEEIARLLHDLARTQITLAVDPDLYRVLEIPKRWFSVPEWRYIAGRSVSMQLVTRDIREALTLLVKQGKTDTQLIDQLVNSTGSQNAALKVTSGIAERHLELGGELSEWLKSGGKSTFFKTSKNFEESRELSSDSALATLMTDANLLEESLCANSEDALMELRMLEPESAHLFDTLVTRCRAVLNDLSSLAAKRNLSIRGKKGEIVEYSQALHELIDGHESGVRNVKIIHPMIVKDRVGKSTEIIRKALAEKV